MKKELIGEYLAPEVEVIEIRNREVLCTSTDLMGVDPVGIRSVPLASCSFPLPAIAIIQVV